MRGKATGDFYAPFTVAVAVAVVTYERIRALVSQPALPRLHRPCHFVGMPS